MCSFCQWYVFNLHSCKGSKNKNCTTFQNWIVKIQFWIFNLRIHAILAWLFVVDIPQSHNNKQQQSFCHIIISFSLGKHVQAVRSYYLIFTILCSEQKYTQTSFTHVHVCNILSLKTWESKNCLYSQEKFFNNLQETEKIELIIIWKAINKNNYSYYINTVSYTHLDVYKRQLCRL